MWLETEYNITLHDVNKELYVILQLIFMTLLV